MKHDCPKMVLGTQKLFMKTFFVKHRFPPPGGTPISQKLVPARTQIFGIKNLAIIDWPQAALATQIFFPSCLCAWKLKPPSGGDPISMKLVLPRTWNFDIKILAIIDWPKAVRGAMFCQNLAQKFFFPLRKRYRHNKFLKNQP